MVTDDMPVDWYLVGSGMGVVAADRASCSFIEKGERDWAEDIQTTTVTWKVGMV